MSSILSRYVIRAVLGHTLLVMLVLLALSGLYLFITQQDDIGVGTYALEDALLFVGLNLPKYAFDMLPIAALIGALLALGNLARSMELIVVRAAGVSVARIAMWVAGAGVILMVLTGVLGELVAPQMEQYGRRMKTFEKFHDYSLAGNRSAWAKDGDTIVSVRPAVGRQSLRRRVRLQLRCAASAAQRRPREQCQHRREQSSGAWRTIASRASRRIASCRRGPSTTQRAHAACRRSFSGSRCSIRNRCRDAACSATSVT